MKIYVLSDLHLETRASFAPDARAAEEADVVILAGDIAVHSEGIRWAAQTFADKPVVYVLGNHEFYGGHISKVALACKHEATGTNVHLLDNGTTVIDGVRFLGCTLWTDFELFGNEFGTLSKAMYLAKSCIRDFSCITFGSTGWMTPAQSVILHRTSREWLEGELDKPFAGPTVVVTHHAPSKGSIAPQFANDFVTAAFVSDLDPLIAKADLWIHGHTHSAFDYRVGKCRVVCNPRGYVSATRSDDQEKTGWDSQLLVEVTA
jgi:predicted phosphodiesterase